MSPGDTEIATEFRNGRIVLGIGTSHSPLLASPPEDYPKHAQIDASGLTLQSATEASHF